MAITLDTTVGGASANSYCSLAEANTYHAAHPYSAVWDAATDDQKNRAPVPATRLIDEQVEWDGVVTNGSVQALLWPRAGMYYQNEWYIPVDVIPQKLKDAVAEFARQRLAEDRTADTAIDRLGIKRIRVGPVDVDFAGGGRSGGRAHARVIP